MSAHGWRRWLVPSLLFVSSAQTNSDVPADAAAAMAELADQVVLGIERQGKVLATPDVLGRASTRVSELFPDQQFTVLFVDDPTPDARAFPNGVIVVNSGLALDLDSPADWEFVLAHEVAHLALNHFVHQLNDTNAQQRAALERDADQMAAQRMADADRDMKSVPALLLRTRKRGEQIIVPGAKDPMAPAESSTSAIVQIQTSALERVLSASQIDRAQTFLARRLPWLQPADVNRWRWMIRQRSGATDDPPGLLTFGLPMASTAGFQGQFPQCAKIAGPQANALQEGLEEGKATRLGSTTFVRDKHWQVALQTGRQLTLTPDRTAITRLDIWKVNRTPTGVAAKPLPCPNTQLALWRALSEFRAMAPQRKLTLDDAQPLDNGLQVSMTMVDETGLRWKLRGWRVVEGEQTIYALFKAPAQHFFQRHLAIAERTARGLLGPT
ncbi:MAG: M48 family metalloprotease [Lysobacterales bacterium]